MNSPAKRKAAAMAQHLPALYTTRISIDPRIKLLHATAAGLILFFLHDPVLILLHLFFIVGILLLFRLYKAAKILFTLALCLYLVLALLLQTPPRLDLLQVAAMHLYLLFKLSPLAGLSIILTESINITEMLSALEKNKIPRFITLPLAVALRFIPTIRQETAYIRDTMKLRNNPLSFWQFLKAPLRMSEYVLVPLLMRCIKVAEELAAAAVVRGIEYPGQRSSLYEIKLTRQDYAYLAVGSFYYAFLIYLQSGVKQL